MLLIRSLLLSALGISFLGLFCSGPVLAQQSAKQQREFRSLEELNTAYDKQLLEIDRQRVSDLAALAARTQGAEADAAYAQLFNIAMARGFCPKVEGVAESCLASESSSRENKALATLVRIIAKSDSGRDDLALAELKNFLKRPRIGGGSEESKDMHLAVSEAYLQRLIRACRYDAARKLCEVACDEEGATAAMKDHFESRMARLTLLGKPAAPIAGVDIDGKDVSLANLKGKVVLVEFWATWCPPCVASIPHLASLGEKYRDRGFEILGINVDTAHEDVKDAKTALPVVRRFLATHDVSWTNLLNDEKQNNYAEAYGVAEIPANFLIGRDGKIVGVELSGNELDRAVDKALGDEGGLLRK